METKVRYTQPYIALCSECKGKGIVDMYCPDDLLNAKEPARMACEECNGTGRVRIRIEKIIYTEPYDPTVR